MSGHTDVPKGLQNACRPFTLLYMNSRNSELEEALRAKCLLECRQSHDSIEAIYQVRTHNKMHSVVATMVA